MSLLDASGLNEEQFLQQYNPGDFPRPSVAADIVIFTIADVEGDNFRKLPGKELRVLLVRRGGHPYIGQWALPGGFMRPGETVGEAANRELVEETGVNGGYLEQLYTFSAPGRDPRAWIISCAHMALIDSGQINVHAGSDAADAQWFVVKTENAGGYIELSLSGKDASLHATAALQNGDTDIQITKNVGLAFDHAKIILYAVNRLRAKLEYTDLVFRLVPERFTLTALQLVFEAILGRTLYKAAFRRKIVDLVQETECYTSDKGHRPAKIYVKKMKEEGGQNERTNTGEF